MTQHRYSGYTSYSYLTAGEDYQQFELDTDVDRVPPYDLGLDESQRARVARLIDENVVISLHEHLVLFPKKIELTREYNRTARQHTGYRGLSMSGMTAVFDNLMDGTACVTSQAGWKWNDIIHDLGMRLSDIAHQNYVRLATSVDDILDAHANGNIAIVMGLEAATPIENELDRIDILYRFGVRQMGIAYSDLRSA